MLRDSYTWFISLSVWKVVIILVGLIATSILIAWGDMYLVKRLRELMGKK